jgi:hypothetical protein
MIATQNAARAIPTQSMTTRVYTGEALQRAIVGLQGVVRNIYTTARKKHQSHTTILARLQAEVYDSQNFQRLTQAGHAELRGYKTALFESMYDTTLVWYVRLNGVLTDPNTIPDAEYKNVSMGAFVYRDAPDCIFSDSADN